MENHGVGQVIWCGWTPDDTARNPELIVHLIEFTDGQTVRGFGEMAIGTKVEITLEYHVARDPEVSGFARARMCILDYAAGHETFRKVDVVKSIEHAGLGEVVTEAEVSAALVQLVSEGRMASPSSGRYRTV